MLARAFVGLVVYFKIRFYPLEDIIVFCETTETNKEIIENIFSLSLSLKYITKFIFCRQIWQDGWCEGQKWSLKHTLTRANIVNIYRRAADIYNVKWLVGK